MNIGHVRQAEHGGRFIGTRSWQAVLVLLLALAGGGFAYVHSASQSVPIARARWALARVRLESFGAVMPVDIGCFTVNPGHVHKSVFVVDASYTNYEQVDCYDNVSGDGPGYRVTVSQTWEDTAPPDGNNPFSWLQRVFYKPSSHTWTYQVHQDGRVVTLSEQGKRTPESYTH